jgi:hypothetical protein
MRGDVRLLRPLCILSLSECTGRCPTPHRGGGADDRQFQNLGESRIAAPMARRYHCGRIATRFEGM